MARVFDDRGSVVHFDGGLGFGQPCGVQAIDLGIERVRGHGIASVLARETTHLGALGYYTCRAAEAGCVALAFQNGPTFVPPFGATTPLFSTNPFSYAVPTGEEPSVVFDIATTAVAGNKLLLAKKRGDPTIPEGWANDEHGRPTTDTERASVASAPVVRRSQGVRDRVPGGVDGGCRRGEQLRTHRGHRLARARR